MSLEQKIIFALLRGDECTVPLLLRLVCRRRKVLHFQPNLIHPNLAPASPTTTTQQTKPPIAHNTTDSPSPLFSPQPTRPFTTPPPNSHAFHRLISTTWPRRRPRSPCLPPPGRGHIEPRRVKVHTATTLVTSRRASRLRIFKRMCACVRACIDVCFGSVTLRMFACLRTWPGDDS